MRFVKIFIAVVFAWVFIFAPAQAEADATTVILVRHQNAPRSPCL